MSDSPSVADRVVSTAAQPITHERHLSLTLIRVVLGTCVMLALPLAHAHWGESYPDDGQHAFGFIIIFLLIGVVAACLYGALGSLAQFLLRARAPLFTLLVDVALSTTFAGLLVYAGVTAKYSDTPPNTEPVQEFGKVG